MFHFFASAWWLPCWGECQGGSGDGGRGPGQPHPHGLCHVYQGGGPRQPPAGPDGGDGLGHGQLLPVWHPQDWPPRQLPRPSGPRKQLPVKDQETHVSDTESSAIISTSGWQGRRKLNQVKLWVLSIRKFLHSWQFMSPSDTWLFLTCLDMNWLCMSG